MASMCNTCLGKGYIIVCWDDLCQEECMHGDGEATCPECTGEGELWDEDDLAEWDEDDLTPGEDG